MKTNFKNPKSLVLSSGNNQIIAVIPCKLGVHRFRCKVTQAISKHHFANQAIVHTQITIKEDATTHLFKATIYYSNKSEEKYFKLKVVPSY